MEEQTLAMEILHELKASSKRWFIAFITTLILWFATIGAFLWYVSLPIEDYTVEVTNDDGSANYVGGDVTGRIYNGISESAEDSPGE